MVGPAGEQVGIVRIEDALRLAAESDLDLVEVAPQAKPPVAKLMDFGKYKYEAAVKAREARKNQTNTVLKEIRFRLKIDTHDYETKRGHAIRFLGAGDKVKAMIQFRGREQQRPEMGIRLLQKFAEDVSEVGVVESTPRIDGRNMVMVIGPVKNKAEAKAEARRAAQRADSKAANDASKTKVDTSSDKSPMTQSIGDLLPEGLRSAQQAAPAESEAPVSEAPAVETPAVEKPTKQAVESPSAAESVAAPAAEKAVPEPKVSEPKTPEPKTSEPKVSESKVSEAKTEPAVRKPAAAPKPQAAPKPSASAKPAATPKPSAAAKPAATPKPAGKTTPAKGSTSRPKPGGSN